MSCAFVLLNVELAFATEVKEQVERMKNVREVHRLHGVYDLIAKVEADTPNDLKDSLTGIRRLNRVHSTVTLTVTHSHP